MVRPRRYQPLADYLATQPAAATRLTLTLGQVETILGATLPPSARKSAWWANDPGLSQGRAWLDAGWRTVGVRLGAVPPTVTFGRQASDATP